MQWPAVNFDSRWRFSYDMEQERLLVEDGRNLPHGLWLAAGVDNVESVSAVVGANGCGKTSIARCLALAFANGQRNGRPYVVIAEERDSIHAYTNVHESKVDGVISPLREKFGNRLVPHVGEAVGGGAECQERERYFLYLSPHMSPERAFYVKSKGVQRVFDYSSVALLDDIAERQPLTSRNPLRAYAAEEKCRIIRAAYSYARIGRTGADAPSEQTRIIRAEQLVIQLKNKELSECAERFQIALSDDAATVCDVSRRILKHRLFKGKACEWPFKIFAAFAVAYWTDLCPGDGADFALDRRGAELVQICEQMMSAVGEQEQPVLARIDRWIAEWTPQGADSVRVRAEKRLRSGRLKALGRLIHALNALSPERHRIRGGRIVVRLSRCPDEEFLLALEAVNAYFEAIGETEFMTFDLTPQLSSGEISFLSIWGRLLEFADGRRRIDWVSVGSRSVRRPSKPYDLVLFMDEAETALHPEWQRMLVWNTLWFFNRLVPEAHVHIIFATHSPILLSDIPWGNATFLIGERAKARRKRQLALLKSFQGTFAANIFDLYHSPFFLENGTVGELARRRVDGLLDVVRDRKRRIGRDEALLWDLIGDPFLRGSVKMIVRKRLRR